MFVRKTFFVTVLFALISGLGTAVLAQSSDQALPTPVLSNDVTGRVEPLDLGDPRLTRHYYAFSGAPGVVLITRDSKNLNGDLDVFTAITFRPLMKTTMYANVQSQEISKSIYLRTHQILILRVEARTPNDEPGTYHIHFGGTFESFTGGIPVAEVEATETASEKSGANRLSSVGATIPKPVTETTETAEAKPTPEKPPEETDAAKPATTTKPVTTSRRATARTRRGPRPAPSKPAPAKKTEPETPAETNAPAKEPAEAQEVPAPPGAHLIIEQKDGTRIDRPMSTVRRVIIEGPAIVIILKNGKIQRIAMSDVARMAIEPQ